MAKKKQEVKLEEPVRIRFKQLANGNFASCTQILLSNKNNIYICHR